MFSQQSNTLNTHNHSLKPTHIVIREASGALMDCTKAARFTIFVVEFIQQNPKPIKPKFIWWFCHVKNSKSVVGSKPKQKSKCKIFHSKSFVGSKPKQKSKCKTKTAKWNVYSNYIVKFSFINHKGHKKRGGSLTTVCAHYLHLLGSKNLGTYVFRTLMCIIGKAWSKQVV